MVLASCILCRFASQDIPKATALTKTKAPQGEIDAGDDGDCDAGKGDVRKSFAHIRDAAQRYIRGKNGQRYPAEQGAKERTQKKSRHQ